MVGEEIRSPRRILLSVVLCLQYCGLPFPARGSVPRLYKRRTIFFTGPWLWPLTTLLSSCVGASTGLLGGGRLCGLGINAGTKRGSASARVRVVENSFTGGFVSFLVFAGCAPVCCAQQLCPLSECPFECAHYFLACPLFSRAH